MTHAIARPANRVHGALYWKGTQVRSQVDVTFHRSDAATWGSEAAARAAVNQRAPWLWRMGYRVVVL